MGGQLSHQPHQLDAPSESNNERTAGGTAGLSRSPLLLPQNEIGIQRGCLSRHPALWRASPGSLAR